MKMFFFIIPFSLLVFLSGCDTLKEIDRSTGAIDLIPDNQKPTDEIILGTRQIREIDGVTMVYVPAGLFKMGMHDPDLCLNADPAHTMSLHAFWIDQQVTNSMFSNFLNAEGNQSQNGIPCLEPGAGHREITYGFIEEIEGAFITQEGYEDHPIIEVSWYGASAF